MDLKAVVTKEGDGETTVKLDWRHTAWYTQLETNDGDTGDNNATADTAHTYQYCVDEDCNTPMFWRDIPTTSTDNVTNVTYTDKDGGVIPATPARTPNNTPIVKGDRATFTISNLDAANTYVIQVRAKKSTQVDRNNNNVYDDDADDPDNDQESQASRIDPVGPQTVTADSAYSLPVDVDYSSATSLHTDVLQVAYASSLTFIPLKEGSADRQTCLTPRWASAQPALSTPSR